ncbi:hypothetical protein SAMN05444065_12616 [Pseudomonas syringae]|uniref:DUF1534 domain-containing protein n=1 Tax=Pseudomonas syringae TaxID=317 RepID=A0AB38C0T6_PSESX|nr:hypothetical protein SAMN05444065_12616 [Pseudomonas syringae]SFO92975.1 hypothetical protein SAMN05444063_12916 [Pseudomonas syringae]
MGQVECLFLLTRTSAGRVLAVVYQGCVRKVGRSDNRAVHQPRLIIDLHVRLGTEVIPVALCCLAHFRAALAILVLGRTGRMN